MLITYDHGEMKSAVDGALEIIKGYKHIQITESSFAIETYEKTRTIFNKILPFLGSNARLLVVTLIRPFAGPVKTPLNEWLLRHLPEE